MNLLEWLYDRRGIISLWVALYFAARMLADAWAELGPLSFAILTAAALFDLGVLWMLVWGFATYRDDKVVQDQQRRRAENRMPRKRFG